MYLISKGEYKSLKRVNDEHASLIDSIAGDVNGGQVNHIEIGEGGKVVIKPNHLSASGKSSKAKISRASSPSQSTSSHNINNNFSPNSTHQTSTPQASVQDASMQDLFESRFRALPQDSFDDPEFPQSRFGYSSHDIAAQVDLPNTITRDGSAQANIEPEAVDGSAQANIGPETRDGSAQARPETMDGVIQAGPETRDGTAQTNIRPQTRDGANQTNIRPVTKDGSSQANIRPGSKDVSSQANIGPVTKDGSSQANIRPVSKDGSSQANIKPRSNDNSSQANIRPESKDGSAQANIKNQTWDGSTQANIKPNTKEDSVQANIKPSSKDGSVQTTKKPGTKDGTVQANIKSGTTRDSYSQMNNNQFRSFPTQTEKDPTIPSQAEKDPAIELKIKQVLLLNPSLKRSEAEAIARAMIDAEKSGVGKHGKKTNRPLPNRTAHTDATDGSAPNISTLTGKKLKNTEHGKVIPVIQPPRSNTRGVKDRKISHKKKPNVLVMTPKPQSTIKDIKRTTPPGIPANQNTGKKPKQNQPKKKTPIKKVSNKTNAGVNKKNAGVNKNNAGVNKKNAGVNKKKTTSKTKPKNKPKKTERQSDFVKQLVEYRLKQLSGNSSAQTPKPNEMEDLEDCVEESDMDTNSGGLRGKRQRVPVENSSDEEGYVPRKSRGYVKKKT